MQPRLLKQRKEVRENVAALRKADNRVVRTRPFDVLSDRPEDAVETVVVALERVGVVPRPPTAVHILEGERHFGSAVVSRRMAEHHGL